MVVVGLHLLWRPLSSLRPCFCMNFCQRWLDGLRNSWGRSTCLGARLKSLVEGERDSPTCTYVRMNLLSLLPFLSPPYPFCSPSWLCFLVLGSWSKAWRAPTLMPWMPTPSWPISGILRTISLCFHQIRYHWSFFLLLNLTPHLLGLDWLWCLKISVPELLSFEQWFDIRYWTELSPFLFKVSMDLHLYSQSLNKLGFSHSYVNLRNVSVRHTVWMFLVCPPGMEGHPSLMLLSFSKGCWEWKQFSKSIFFLFYFLNGSTDTLALCGN